MLIIQRFNFDLLKMTIKIKTTLPSQERFSWSKENVLYFSAFDDTLSCFLSKGTCSFILHWNLQITELVLPLGLRTLRGKKAKEEFFTFQPPHSPSGS